VEDWAEIRRLHRADGLPIKTIARTLGVSRNTVRAAISSESPPKYQRRPAGSAVDEYPLSDHRRRHRRHLLQLLPDRVLDMQNSMYLPRMPTLPCL
jgi:transposase